MILATTFFKGPCGLLVKLLARDDRARRLFDKLYDDRLVVSTTRMVLLASLRCTQSHMDGDAIAEYIAQPRLLSVDRLHCVSDLPVVVSYKSQLFIIDGHHRLGAKKVQGLLRAKVYFWDLDALLGRVK